MMRIQLVSPMETVFRPESFAPYTSCSALRGEETAFQAVLTGQEACRPVLRTDAPVHAEIFRIGFVPCALAAYPDRHDADYLTTEPGLSGSACAWTATRPAARMRLSSRQAGSARFSASR